jgi:hypothetical protein
MSVECGALAAVVGPALGSRHATVLGAARPRAMRSFSAGLNLNVH